MGDVADIFRNDEPEIRRIETPAESETVAEVNEQKKRERESLGAFFTSLRQGGAEELRKPSSTGLQL